MAGIISVEQLRDDDVVADATAPFSAPNVLRIAFTPDMLRDHEPSVHWLGLPATREVYALWWIKLSANWSPSPAGGGKMTFLHAAPDGQGQVYSGLFGATAPHRVSINTEWAPYGQHVWDPNVETTAINYGEWYRVEWYLKWDSAPGAGDGVLRWWVNGVLNGNHSDVRFPARAWDSSSSNSRPRSSCRRRRRSTCMSTTLTSASAEGASWCTGGPPTRRTAGRAVAPVLALATLLACQRSAGIWQPPRSCRAPRAPRYSPTISSSEPSMHGRTGWTLLDIVS